MIVFFLQNEVNTGSSWGRTEQQQKWCFRERERDLSLDYRAIRPLEFVGTRSKAALQIEAYAWAPVLRSFDKLGRGFFLLEFYTLFKCIYDV